MREERGKNAPAAEFCLRRFPRLAVGGPVGWVLAAMLVLSLLPRPAAAGLGLWDSFRLWRETKKANRLFHQGKYEQARAGYMRAKDLAGEKTEHAYRLHYNIGDTFYKEGNYESAEKEYQQALAVEDRQLREKVFYNLGDVYFQQGLKKNDLELLKKAVEHYQKALELNPDDEDAKFNIEVVRRHIKAKSEQPPPAGQCPNPQASAQSQKQDAQAGQQQPKPGQEKAGEEGEKKAAEEQQQAQPLAGGTAEPRKQTTAEQKKPAGAAQAPEKMSEDEAKRLLQAVQQREEEDLKKVLEAPPARPAGKERDW